MQSLGYSISLHLHINSAHPAPLHAEEDALQLHQLGVLGLQQLRGLGQWVEGAQHGDADGAKSNVLHLIDESCSTLCFPDEKDYLEAGPRNSFGWPTIGCMHQKTVGMFMTVPLLMEMVESREVLEGVVM